MTAEVAASAFPGVDGLDARGCADALAETWSQVVTAELAQVRLVGHWCDLHSEPAPTDTTHSTGAPGACAFDGRVVPGVERVVAPGGDGTPRVAEFAAAELGLLLRTTTHAARTLMRDVLDLRHRHPRLHAAVLAGGVRFFAARHVVRATRTAGLTRDQARTVDARVAPYLGQLPWGRLLDLVEAAVIAADPEAAEQRRLAAELERFVRTGRSSEHGTKTIYARARAGDALYFFAVCDRIAQILALRARLGLPEPTAATSLPRETMGTAGAEDPRTMDVLRAEAIGILARPDRALALLTWGEHHTDEPDVDSDPASDPDPDPDLDAGPDTADPAVPAGGGAPVVVRHPATVYVHLSWETFLRQTRGTARVEDLGPVTLEQATGLLGHCQVQIRPVVDLNANPAADGYEASRLVRETTHLRHPVEVFPYGTLPSRRADLDHTRPWTPDDPRDSRQTCADNLGPLSRFHHRVKTHGGWQCHQPEPGVFYWRSPHGHWARVDPTGTTYLGTGPPAALKIDVRPQDLEIRLTG